MGGCGSKIRDAPNHAVVVAPAPLPSPPSSKAPSPSKKVAPTPAAAQPAADVAATPPSASAAPARAASPAPRSDDAAALPSPNRLAPLDPTLTTPLATIDVVPASPALESRHVEDESEQLEDAFCKTMAFGTAGLRAKEGVGFNRMNSVTVALTSQGIASYILEEEGPPEQELGTLTSLISGTDTNA